MSVTKTSLVNKALTLCGALPITSLSDGTNNSDVVNRVYDIARQSILSECLWTFATTRATLSITSATLSWSYATDSYTYTKPTGVIKIFEVYPCEAIWREEGMLIITDTASLGIKYIYDCDDPLLYQPFFTEAFIDKLCVDISYMIINSTQKAEAFFTKYQKVSLPKARSANSQIGVQQVPIDGSWTDAKVTNGRPDRSYG